MKTHMLTLCLLAAAALPAAAAPSASTPVLLNVQAASAPSQFGSAVLWGGRVLARDDNSGQTCLTIVAAPLTGAQGRPELPVNYSDDADRPGSRFFACGASTFSSADFNKGRLVTVAGRFAAIQERMVRGDCADHQAIVSHLPAESCVMQIPVVAVDDARSWASDPHAQNHSLSP